MKGAVVTADAMFTHADFCRKVREGGGDYILAVKENQPALLADLEAAFAANAALSPYQQRQQKAAQAAATRNGKGHGRRERRTVVATIEPNAYLAAQWAGLGQVYRIERERWDEEGHSAELAYRITSLDPEQADAARLSELDRGHWSIENGLHYVRGVTMGEDACRVRSGTAAQLLAATRNAVLCLARKVKAKSIAAAFRRFMVHPREALELLECSE